MTIANKSLETVASPESSPPLFETPPHLELIVTPDRNLAADIGRMSRHGLDLDVEITDQNRHHFYDPKRGGSHLEVAYMHSAMVVGILEGIKSVQSLEAPAAKTHEWSYWDTKGEFHDKITLAGLDEIIPKSKSEREKANRVHEVYLEGEQEDGQRYMFTQEVGKIYAFTLAYDESKDLNKVSEQPETDNDCELVQNPADYAHELAEATA